MRKLTTALVAALSIASISSVETYAQSADKVSAELIKKTIPTYDMGPDDPCTYMKDFRVEGLYYFRDSRSVYPYTFKNIYRETKQDVEYDVVRLENDHIYVDIIPALRGRIQGAVDKRNGWDFLYYNNVIKPAEVSVRSAWLSGGLEYNHPGGHGYTQLESLSYEIEEYEDGSKAVIVTEIEPNRMMKWQYEIILRPDDLAIETKGRFISIVPYDVPFVSSNNAAMHVTDEMELTYPQETWATGHGNGHLRKWSEYSNDGSDWNWVKNLKHSLSLFTDGTGNYEDYWGVYSHDKGIEAGSVVVSDHRQCPGKKYFSWGTSESGKQWDTFLSDTDGGYIELQHQAFNSKMNYDYGQLAPFEVKEFSIFWYPIAKTDGFIKASREVALNFELLKGKQLKLDFASTINIPNAKIVIKKNGEVAKEINMDLVVGESYNELYNIASTESDKFTVDFYTAEGRNILDYQTSYYAYKPDIPEIGAHDKGKPSNDELTINQLYTLAMDNQFDPYGIDADEYVEEILKRDPFESRALLMKGVTEIKRGEYPQAIATLRKSLEDGYQKGSERTRFSLGVACFKAGDLYRAHEWFCQSSRFKEFNEASLFYLAAIEVIKGDLFEARMRLEEVPFSRLTHPDIYNLLSYVCRRLGDKEAAQKYLDLSFERDPINFTGYLEDIALNGKSDAKIDKINTLFDRKSDLFIGSQIYIETAIFYIDIMDYDMALEILNIAEEHYQGGKIYPFINYYKGYCLMQKGDKAGAQKYYAKASSTDDTYVFPYRTASIAVLKDVIANNPKDEIAMMYLGDTYYHLRRHNDAIELWSKAYDIDPTNFRICRNLAIGRHVEKYDTIEETIKLMQQALDNSTNGFRIFAELENLYILTDNTAMLTKIYGENQDIISAKGSLALSAADFYCKMGRYEDAQNVLANSFFNAEEKLLGTPFRHVRYEEAYVGHGIELINEGNYKAAIEKLQESYLYPAYLNEAKVNRPITTRADYFLGLAYAKAGQKSNANKYYKKAINQNINDNSVSTIYKAYAMKALGQTSAADKLVDSTIAALSGDSKPVSKFILSLAYEYKGDDSKAKSLMTEAWKADYNVNYNAMFKSSYISARKYSLE